MLKFALRACFCACLWTTLFALETVRTYDATVYDYAPVSDSTIREIILKNIRNIVNEVDGPGTGDIFVFPEYGITGTDVFTHNNLSEFAVSIPDANPGVDLCRGIRVEQAISDLACIDKLKRTAYLVVNMLENANGLIYNTNLVLHKGAIVAKYRKINLNEREKRLTAGTEAVTFQTDFGLTFGLITSDDMLHVKPGQEIFNNRNVTEVIMTSAWQSEVPFYTAVGLQDGYSKKNGVNMMVASISAPAESRGGSGFFIPKGAVIVHVPVVPGIQAKTIQLEPLRVRVPEQACSNLINPRSFPGGSLPNIDSFQTKAMSNIDQYTYKKILASENKNAYEEQFCRGKICCKFTIQYSTNIFDIRPVYKAVVSNDACGIIACDDEEDLSTCGSRNEELSQATFEKITIEAKIQGKKEYQYLPVSSGLDLKNIKYKYCDGASEISMETTSVSGLVYFGIIAPGNSGVGAAHHVVVNISLLAFVSLFIAMYNRFI